MGVSIDLHVLDHAKLMENLAKAGAGDEGRVNEILDRFGHRIGEKYVILNNEYHDDGNPYYGLMAVMDAAFGLKWVLDGGKGDTHDVIARTPGWLKGISYADTHDIAERLGIDISEGERP